MLTLIFAHGNDPQPLPWFVLLSNVVLALVVLAMVGAFSHQFLAPLFQEEDERKKTDLAGWVAIGLGLLIASATWILRQSLTEAVTPPAPELKHRHVLGNGGQMAMWGDYHAELARCVTGEYRLWLTDAYQRPISSDFFSGKIMPRDAKTGQVFEDQALELDDALDKSYRFAFLDRSVRSVQVRLNYPGDSLKLNFVFDETRGRHSLAGWCGLPRPVQTEASEK